MNTYCLARTRVSVDGLKTLFDVLSWIYNMQTLETGRTRRDAQAFSYCKSSYIHEREAPTDTVQLVNFICCRLVFNEASAYADYIVVFKLS